MPAEPYRAGQNCLREQLALTGELAHIAIKLAVAGLFPRMTGRLWCGAGCGCLGGSCYLKGCTLTSTGPFEDPVSGALVAVELVVLVSA